MSKEKILIIDDEASIRSALQGILEDEGYAVQAVESGEAGLQALKGQDFDLLLLDIWLPEMSGLDVLEKVKAGDENPQIIMISGHGTIETAVKATRLGAFDFLEKPLSLEKVVLTVQNALRQTRLEEENVQLREKLGVRFPLIGRSPAIQKLRRDIQLAAPSGGRVLIYGENGTGREHIASLVHQQSRRHSGRFIGINCAAIPDHLIENELFGYVQGTVPNSVKDKKGKLLLADGGTLFLDEIGDMSLKTQAKLVRVIEEAKYEPVGSAEAVSVDARILAGSSKSLKELIAKERFREDLFFKLNVIPLNIPPLRERVEDIPMLIEYFLEHFSDEYGKKRKTMNAQAEKAFLNYSWPGNVSELMNVIERFAIMVPDDEINASHLSLLVETRENENLKGIADGRSLDAAKEQFERKFIHKALGRNAWSVPETAAELKIEESDLKARIKAHNLTLMD
jgi:two-component system, NtrC family, nitrogen regulation response regulator NtrX